MAWYYASHADNIVLFFFDNGISWNPIKRESRIDNKIWKIIDNTQLLV